MKSPRRVAFDVLYKIETEESYSSIAVNKALKENNLNKLDSSFASAIIYGVLEKKITLAASPDSGDYLDEFVVLCVSQALEQSISLNGHVVSSIPKLLDLSKFLEVRELYHAPSRKARATLTSVPFSTLRNGRIRRHGISTTRKRLALKCIHRAAGIVEKRRGVD